MNRFIYLLEEEERELNAVKNFVGIIKKNCQPYLDFIQKEKKHLYRGMRGKNEYGLKTRREDRKPLNTHPVFDHLLNLVLKDQGVIPRSQGIFCKIDPYIYEFGTPYVIFPRDKFDFYYIKGMADITYDLQLGSRDESIQIFRKDFMDLLSSKTLKATSVENFWDKFEDSILEHEDEEDNFRFSFETALSDIRSNFEKIVSSIKGKVVKNSFPPTTNLEIILNADKYYYLNWRIYSKYLGQAGRLADQAGRFGPSDADFNALKFF